MLSRLWKRLREADDKYADASRLKPESVALIEKIGAIQKQLERLAAKVEEIKKQKKEVEPEIVKALNKLDVEGARIGKILVYLKTASVSPSFKQVMEVARKELAPAVQKLLDETYTELQSAKAAEKKPELRVELESIQEGAWGSFVNFLKSKFSALVGGISGALDKIEGLIGGK